MTKWLYFPPHKKSSVSKEDSWEGGTRTDAEMPPTPTSRLEDMNIGHSVQEPHIKKLQLNLHGAT